MGTLAQGACIISADGTPIGEENPLHVVASQGVALAEKAVAVAVAQAVETDLITLDLNGATRVWLEIAVADQALASLKVYAKAHADGSFLQVAGAGSDFTSPIGAPVYAASGDLTALGAGNKGWLVLDVRGLHQVKLAATSANLAGSSVSVYAGGV